MIRCENPDERCRAKPNRWCRDPRNGKELHVCRKCFYRFDRHGSGDKYRSWQKKWNEGAMKSDA